MFAVRGWFFFDEYPVPTSFDSLRNLGRPVPNARVEHPPLKDALDRVLRPGCLEPDNREFLAPAIEVLDC